MSRSAKQNLLMVSLLFLSTLFQADAIAQAEQEGSLDAFLGNARMEMQKGFDAERFPNVVVTLKGTVVATWGNSGVYARRSEDGGKTWGEQIVVAKPGFQGGGTTVDEVTGDILAFVEEHHPPAPLTIYRSKDDGKTWQPSKSTVKPDSKGNVPSMHMNERGITLRHGKYKGRLIRPTRYYGKENNREQWPHHYTNAMYSDDRGETWQTSEPFPENGTGEATLVELSDGSLYYNSRVHWDKRPKNTRRRARLAATMVVTLGPNGKLSRSYPTAISIVPTGVWVGWYVCR